MANPDHLAILKQGVDAWNQWRVESPEIVPDLSDANLKEAKLSGINLKEANLVRANLAGANLERPELTVFDMIASNLKGTKLIGTDLEGANLMAATLEGAKLVGTNLVATNLFGANLKGGNLESAHLELADLVAANLSGANLSLANLEGANLQGADLSGAKFYGASLSGAIMDLRCISVSKHLLEIEIGVNGIYSAITDSAALMQLSPPGNSMQGSNAEAIVESLKHARKLHNISLGFAAVALLIPILRPKEIKLPFFSDFSADSTHFAVLAILVSIGILSLTESFIRSALDGAKYIRDRDSAMKVGHFPWTISKFDKGRWGKSQSLIMRFILCFHPLLYLVLYSMELPDSLSAFFPARGDWLFYLGNGFMILVYFALLALCGRIFWLSQQFQRPILFDPQTEKNRKSDAAILNEKVSELIELLKPKESSASAETQSSSKKSS
jgi:hypothetical protein